MRKQQWISIVRALSLITTLVTGSASFENSASAEPGPYASDPSAPKPIIEVGTGIESAIREGGVNVLLRVGFGFYSFTDEPSGGIIGQEQMVWAHIKGDIAINPKAEGTRVPYIDIEFIPVQNRLEIYNETGKTIVMGNLELFPTTLTRDVRVDDSLTVKVAAIGLQFDVLKMQNDKAGMFAQLALDAIGYKWASYVSDLAKFKGFHVAGLAIEAGEAFFAKENFLIRIALGGAADLNLGGNTGGAFAVQSDMKAYLSVKAHIKKMITLFLRGGMVGRWNSGHDAFEGSPEMMLGATIIF